jgi:hypothetical protein
MGALLCIAIISGGVAVWTNRESPHRIDSLAWYVSAVAFFIAVAAGFLWSLDDEKS